MATSGKQKMKVDVDIDPFAECGNEKKWAIGVADIKKACKPITFKGEAELDPDEWTEKKLADAAKDAARMGLKIFSARVVDAQKAAGGGSKGKAAKGGDAPKGKSKGKGGPEEDAAEDLIKEYEDLADDITKGLKKWLKDIETGKADSAKNLKDCANAFKEFNKAEIDDVFTVPRERAVDALTELSKAGGKGGKGPDEDAVTEAKEALDEAMEEFKEHGKTVADAISALMGAAKSTEGNKKADADLKGFAEQVKAVAKKADFKGVVDAAAKMEKALADALKSVEDGKTDPQSLRSQVEALKKTSGLDKLASDAARAAAKLEKDFDKVKTKLK